MAEQEAISVLKMIATHGSLPTNAKDEAIKALEEVQQYRAIGTVEGYERAIESSIENYNLYREYKAKVQEYRTIGTVEECRENKEFLDFLYNRINPNDMEQYLSMYNCSDEKIN